MTKKEKWDFVEGLCDFYPVTYHDLTKVKAKVKKYGEGMKVEYENAVPLLLPYAMKPIDMMIFYKRWQHGVQVSVEGEKSLAARICAAGR